MRNVGYLSVAAGGIAALLAIVGASFAMFYLGIVSAVCGAILIAVCNLAQRLDAIEDRIAQLSNQNLSTEELVEQLRQDGLLRGGAQLDEESVEELLEN